tara:strand:- start:2051 stop:2887 length:837 start_codon:yes stop_codon:yes gene_type:complete
MNELKQKLKQILGGTELDYRKLPTDVRNPDNLKGEWVRRLMSEWNVQWALLPFDMVADLMTATVVSGNFDEDEYLYPSMGAREELCFFDKQGALYNGPTVTYYNAIKATNYGEWEGSGRNYDSGLYAQLRRHNLVEKRVSLGALADAYIAQKRKLKVTFQHHGMQDVVTVMKKQIEIEENVEAGREHTAAMLCYTSSGAYATAIKKRVMNLKNLYVWFPIPDINEQGKIGINAMNDYVSKEISETGNFDVWNFLTRKQNAGDSDHTTDHNGRLTEDYE